MLDEKKIRFYKHEILSISAILTEGIELLLEELEEGETDVLEMYKEKSNKLDKILNELSSSIMEEHK